METQIAALHKERPSIPTTLVMQERKTPRVTHIHLGGDFLRKGARVAPDVPRVLPPLANRLRKLPGDRTTRLDLARWLVNGKNPLTARVTVNRFWQQYFGSRHRRDRERLRHAGHAAVASRVARLAGDGVHGPRLEHEGDAPADRHLGDVPAIVASSAGAGDARRAQSPAGPAESPAARRRGGARRGPGVERAVDAQHRRTQRLSAAAAGRVRLHASAARLEGEHRRRTATAVACTRSSGARPRTRT